MHVRLTHRGPIVVRRHDGPSVFRRLSPTGVPRINTLIHGHHGGLAHVIVHRRLLHHGRSLIIVRTVIIRRSTAAHVDTGRSHLVIVHGRSHAVDVGHAVGVTVIVGVHFGFRRFN